MSVPVLRRVRGMADITANFDNLINYFKTLKDAESPSTATGAAQVYWNLTPSMSFGTTYMNYTGRQIRFIVRARSTAAAAMALTLWVDGLSVSYSVTYAPGSGYIVEQNAIVPDGSAYAATGSNCVLDSWFELR